MRPVGLQRLSEVARNSIWVGHPWPSVYGHERTHLKSVPEKVWCGSLERGVIAQYFMTKRKHRLQEDESPRPHKSKLRRLTPTSGSNLTATTRHRLCCSNIKIFCCEGDRVSPTPFRRPLFARSFLRQGIHPPPLEHRKSSHKNLDPSIQ
ncbi:hypothetical protein TNCV_2130861 [Trichonephila clavipes]|nr:hypothetical protein TNCV_2130861 [Trichonephila clavipes]